MPQRESGDSDAPDLRELLEKLDAASSERREARERQSAASARCRELVIALMRRGLMPRELEGRPFAKATLVEIRREIGLSKTYRKRRKTRKHS